MMRKGRIMDEHARVASLAYACWERRGRPIGSPDVDWREAVAALARVVCNPVPISALGLEPNEGSWLRGK